MSKRTRLVFWVLAISRESFELAYREIGDRLNIPGIDNNNADIKKLVQDYLTSDQAGRWLMIVDNADDQDVLLGVANSSSKSVRLIDYLPRSNQGAVLFTTRSRKAAVALTQDSVLELTDLGKPEARQLLSHRLTDLALLNNDTAVDELLEMLTYLPLAVVQAAAFMNSNNVSVTSYILLFQQAGANAELFHEPFVDPGRYEELDSTIAKTWHISFDQICKQDPLAAQYLSFMACINRVNIPQSLVAGRSSLVQQTKALGTLTGYAFLTERQQTEGTGEGRCFDMHRLVHMASVWWLDRHNKRTAWEDTAAARLTELLPYGDYKNMQVWSSYLPHAMHVARSCSVVDTAAGALLLNRVGRCQTSLGQHAAAEMTRRQELSINKEVLGPEHPDTLVSMHELGEAVYNRGKYAEAERVHLETLVLRKKVLGDECVGTLRSMNNVAVALGSQGKYIEAEALHHEVLRLKRKILGEEHSSTLKSVSNLAEGLGNQGKYAEAEEAHREVLRLRGKMFGEEHPDTLNSMSNLAGALSAQGKYAEAEEIGRKTLGLRLELLGDKHPNTLLSMSNLAFVLAKQLFFDEARCMYEQAYSGYNTVLGEDHPWTRTCHQLYDDLLALQEQDWISAEKKVETKEDGSGVGDETEAPAALPSVETHAIHPPSRPVLDGADTSAISIKRSGWRNSPTLSFIKSRGVRGVANLLQRRTSLPESRK
jgi:tetratricopeptide (TPR) repeat protein